MSKNHLGISLNQGIILINWPLRKKKRKKIPNIAKAEKGNTCLYSFWWSIKALRSRTKWKWVSLPSLPVTTDVVLRKSMNSYGSWFYHLENEVIVGLISGLNKIRHAQHLWSRSSRNDSCCLLFHLHVQPPGKKYIWSLGTWEIFLSRLKALGQQEVLNKCELLVRSLCASPKCRRPLEHNPSHVSPWLYLHSNCEADQFPLPHFPLQTGWARLK